MVGWGQPNRFYNHMKTKEFIFLIKYNTDKNTVINLSILDFHGASVQKLNLCYVSVISSLALAARALQKALFARTHKARKAPLTMASGTKPILMPI